MDFWFAVQTPANTAKTAAVETELKLSVGTIVRVWMFHPEGCHALAHAVIMLGGHQLYPHNPAESYHGNDVPMIWEDNFELGFPAELKLKTWNLDETYPHYVFLRITVIRPEKDPLLMRIIDLLSLIRSLLVGRRVD